MRSIIRKSTALLFLGLFLMTLTTRSIVSAPEPLPNPVLYLTGTETYQTGGKEFIRISLTCSTELIRPSCCCRTHVAAVRRQHQASRTWVDFSTRAANVSTDFVLSASPMILADLVRAESSMVPPSYVYRNE